jgi:hypothetical protein
VVRDRGPCTHERMRQSDRKVAPRTPGSFKGDPATRVYESVSFVLELRSTLPSIKKEARHQLYAPLVLPGSYGTRVAAPQKTRPTYVNITYSQTAQNQNNPIRKVRYYTSIDAVTKHVEVEQY